MQLQTHVDIIKEWSESSVYFYYSAVVKRYFLPVIITGKGIVISCFVTKSEKYKLFFSDFQNVEIIGC